MTTVPSNGQRAAGSGQQAAGSGQQAAGQRAARQRAMGSGQLLNVASCSSC